MNPVNILPPCLNSGRGGPNAKMPRLPTPGRRLWLHQLETEISPLAPLLHSASPGLEEELQSGLPLPSRFSDLDLARVTLTQTGQYGADRLLGPTSEKHPALSGQLPTDSGD